MQTTFTVYEPGGPDEARTDKARRWICDEANSGSSAKLPDGGASCSQHRTTGSVLSLIWPANPALPQPADMQSTKVSHTSIYTHMHIHTYTYIHIYIYTYTHTHTYIYICKSLPTTAPSFQVTMGSGLSQAARLPCLLMCLRKIACYRREGVAICDVWMIHTSLRPVSQLSGPSDKSQAQIVFAEVALRANRSCAQVRDWMSTVPVASRVSARLSTDGSCSLVGSCL